MEEETRTEQSGLITEELRDWMGASTHNIIGTELIMGSYNKLLAIADRIDEQYDRTCRALDSAWSATAHEVLEQAIDELSDEWVKLPVDADGEIWTGNERVFEVGSGTRYDMRYLMYDGEKWIIDSSFGGFIANECHHVQPDSWERIIEDAAWYGKERQFVGTSGDCERIAVLVERCKRLAGE